MYSIPLVEKGTTISRTTVPLTACGGRTVAQRRADLEAAAGGEGRPSDHAETDTPRMLTDLVEKLRQDRRTDLSFLLFYRQSTILTVYFDYFPYCSLTYNWENLGKMYGHQNFKQSKSENEEYQ